MLTLKSPSPEIGFKKTAGRQKIYDLKALVENMGGKGRPPRASALKAMLSAALRSRHSSRR